MTLLAGEALSDTRRFFSAGNAAPKGSSFDLTIGTIYDHKGRKVSGQFNLKPGRIVQVASAEVFDLPANITGHVTYKTTLTKKGIWALTVGIVDPGWRGPVATTLLNFSKASCIVSEGDAFLRVSLFEHAEAAMLRHTPTVEAYHREVQEAALTLFPRTFLDSEAVANKAAKSLMRRIWTRALIWVSAIALCFAIAFGMMQYTAMYLAPKPPAFIELRRSDVDALRRRIDELEAQVSRAERLRTPAANDGAISPPDLRPPRQDAPTQTAPSTPTPSGDQGVEDQKH